MKRMLYPIMLILSLGLLVFSFTVFARTQWVGGIVLAIGVYLFLGALIKICKTNDKLKNTLICAIDLLFWLP